MAHGTRWYENWTYTYVTYITYITLYSSYLIIAPEQSSYWMNNNFLQHQQLLMSSHCEKTDKEHKTQMTQNRKCWDYWS